MDRERYKENSEEGPLAKSSLVSIIVTCTFMVAFLNGQKGEFHDADLYRIIIEVKDAVVRQDTEYLMRYVNPRGIDFIDNNYTYDEIDEAMRDKDSWLYKWLFLYPSSPKALFDGVTDLEIRILHQAPEIGGFLVTYRSANSPQPDWEECCFYKEDGKWYFDGIFSCG